MKRKEGEMELVCFEVAFLVCCVASSSFMLVCVCLGVVKQLRDEEKGGRDERGKTCEVSPIHFACCKWCMMYVGEE